MTADFEAEVTVRFVRYANESTGWAVLDAAAADGSPVALVGPLVHLEERERVRVVGHLGGRQPLRAPGQGLRGAAAAAE